MFSTRVHVVSHGGGGVFGYVLAGVIVLGIIAFVVFNLVKAKNGMKRDAAQTSGYPQQQLPPNGYPPQQGGYPPPPQAGYQPPQAYGPPPGYGPPPVYPQAPPPPPPPPQRW